MALRKRGKAGCWHVYFDTVRETENGPRRIRTTINLGTTDKKEARALESELMRKNRETIMRKRVERLLSCSEIPNSSPAPVRVHRKRRLLIADALDAAETHRALGETTKLLWRQFARRTKQKYMDEVTPDIMFDYLNKNFGGKNGKSYNNNKSALNQVFRLTLLESGMDESPVAKIPQRRVVAEHQRPLTEDEFIRIYHAAEQPWKSAAMIAWHTGMRKKDVFTLKWSELDVIPGFIVHTPGKTARFGRAVCIPVHKQLADELAALPRVNERVLGAWYYGTKDEFQKAFQRLVCRLGIKSNEQGFVSFNSFRDSFITRCDENGVPRHATRGMAGQKSDRITDLYSHDMESCKRILDLPPVNLDKQVEME